MLNWPADKPNPQEYWGTQLLNFNLNAIGTGQVVMTVPAGCMMRFLGLDFSGTNNDAAFPASPIVMFTDSENHQFAEIFGPEITHGATNYYSYWSGGRVYQPAGATVFFNHSLPDFAMRQGYKLQFFITNNVSVDFTTRLHYYQYTYER